MEHRNLLANVRHGWTLATGVTMLPRAMQGRFSGKRRVCSPSKQLEAQRLRTVHATYCSRLTAARASGDVFAIRGYGLAYRNTHHRQHGLRSVRSAGIWLQGGITNLEHPLRLTDPYSIQRISVGRIHVNP